MANQIALWLMRSGQAQMSCIAGVGGGVAGLVRTARSGRPILALDGCVMHCVKACLAQAGVQASIHLTLSTFGVAKRRDQDFDPGEAERVYAEHVMPALESMSAASQPPG
ncbi:MAG: zinc-binding protein [Xanthomonadales bacterium]|nr:zinc-binding protein [Xanthomonadales bacterium]